ncbi:39S ribosomal protein L48, mitochondrial, partial [Frankliniella fusca]
MSVIKSMSSLRPRLKCLPSLRTLYCCRIKLSQNFSTEPPPTEEPPVEYVPKPQLPGKQSLYNPDYLEILKPNIPKYPTLNIKLKGNDYAVLERLQSIIHKYLLHMGVTVTESFAKRAESFKVVRFAPNSSKPMTEYILKEYERVIQ